MNNDIRQLEPAALWAHFSDLNAVPRPSKREHRAAAFVLDFGTRLGLPTTQDDTGNVLIRKPATAGLEDRVTLVLQGHLDMVHQKNADTKFDFDREGIRMRVDGDWVKAEGTTLGADNGIGVAAIMAVLAADDIPHPAIEALFTIDEETGMTGASGLQDDVLSGEILLNLDTEDDTELTIGCAGAVNVGASGSYAEERPGQDDAAFRLSVQGLTGGHSGMDIHRGRGNANKLINRLLSGAAEECGMRIGAIDAGGLRNAIPREAFAILTVDRSHVPALQEFIATQAAVLRSEYAVTDPHLEVLLEPAEQPAILLAPAFQQDLLRAVYACPNGVFRMSPEIDGLVQTSNNLARLRVDGGTYEILCLVRSALDSEKMDLARAIRGAFELLGATVSFSGAYPGWAPRPEAPVVKLMSGLYDELFDREPAVLACHAGLECGIIGARYPAMQMISFGPNIRGAHSPDEKVQITSVQKFWQLLLEALTRIDL
ncbi:MAG: aminoacyl-histidine dipeptidase [Lysobacterales bacterium]